MTSRASCGAKNESGIRVDPEFQNSHIFPVFFWQRPVQKWAFLKKFLKIYVYFRSWGYYVKQVIVNQLARMSSPHLSKQPPPLSLSSFCNRAGLNALPNCSSSLIVMESCVGSNTLLFPLSPRPPSFQPDIMLLREGCQKNSCEKSGLLPNQVGGSPQTKLNFW